MSPHCDLASVRAFVLLTPLLYLEAAAQVGPSITKPLANQSRSLGDRATFTIVATGDDPLSYQWHFNGSPIANATNRSITIKELTVAHAGSYAATVSNVVSAVSSNAAMLDVDTTFRLMVDSPVSRSAKWNVSWGDYDHDGYIDLFSAGEGQNRLFHNNGDGSFTAVGSTNAIVRRGNNGNDVHAIWADYDNDGNLDLFLPQGVAPARNQLYRGLGNGAFQLVTDAPVGTDTTASFSAVWSDFNRDGRLDLFLSNVGPGPGQTATNIIYLGQPGGSFVRWGPTGLAKEFARHYGATTGDFNEDGWPDLAVVANPGGKNLVLENQRGEDFEVFLIASTGGFGGSFAAADYDNDGHLDLFAAWNTEHYHLFHGDGASNFKEVTDAGPTQQLGRSLGATWGDYDNDGWLDLFLPRFGGAEGDNDRNDSIYHNNGDGTFTRVPAGSVGNDGIESAGAAWADYDNDGFLDLVVASYDSNPSRLYHNEKNANAWLVLNLVGTKSNRSAIGAKIRLKALIGGKSISQLREVGTGAGWFSQNDPRAHFGLGDATQADEVLIEWPSGQTQKLNHIATRQFLTITEPGGAPSATIQMSVEGALRLQIHVQGDPATRYLMRRSADFKSWDSAGEVTTDSNGRAEWDFPFPERIAAAGFWRVQSP